MDWNAAIEKNREALKRVLALLVAMATLGFQEEPAVHPQDGSSRKPCPPTLPRHLHRAVLRLLRPAEAAARRLIIIAARGLVVALPPARPRKAGTKPVAPVLRSFGIAVVMSSTDLARLATGRGASTASRDRPRPAPGLPLLDPIRLPRPGHFRHVPAHGVPRISFPGATAPHRLPPPPAPDDPLDATRLGLRLQALASALDDLPKHARRFARWQARRDRAGANGRTRRLSPLKPGRPPGLKRRPGHEVHETLADLHYFAREALAQPDTS